MLNRDAIDAQRWRAFVDTNLIYMREPLEKRGTGELVQGESHWTIWCRLPDKAMFTDAIDELIRRADRSSDKA